MPGPFNMPPFSNGMPDFDKINKIPQPPLSPELMSMFLEDMKSHDDGMTVAPDTIGADYFFVLYFVNDDMSWDFDRIEEDFLKHCFSKLQEFGEVRWYGHNAARYSDPQESHHDLVMGLILNGVKAGDEYCRALVRYLFKTYHKNLYKSLKRFSKISVDEIMSIADTDKKLDLGNIGIILTMCDIEGIVMSDRCSILYRYLDKVRMQYENDDEEATEYMDFADNLFEDCQKIVEQWMEEDEKKNSNFRKQNREYWDGDQFVSGCLQHLGYPEDYMMRCMENFMGLKIQFTRTLAVLKTVFPKREFTYEEVQRYAVTYGAVSSLVDVSEVYDRVNQIFLGLNGDYDTWDEETLFHPEKIIVANTPKQLEKKPLAMTAKIENKGAAAEDYLAEIDELRRRLAQREMELSRLKVQYSSEHTAKKEAESMLSEYENDRQELIALREFAYKLENEAPEDISISVEDMKKEIADKNYFIIGGHINWINKLKAEFPKWTCVVPSDYKTVDAKSLENKDMIFFFTDHISHSAYGKIIAAARERKLPFSYLHGVNMEQIIKQIYESGK